MGPGFRFMDIRLDQVAHLGLTIVTVLALAIGILTLVSGRTQAGRAALIAALGLFITSNLIGAVFTIVTLNPDPQAFRWLGLLSLANRLVSIGGVGFLIIGLRALLQRNDLLETLQEEALDDRD